MFEEESTEHNSWEDSGYGGFIAVFHSVPCGRRLIISVDHMVRIRNVKCFLWFGCEVCFTCVPFVCGRFGSQLLDQ